ncbi:MAG: isoprenyl transferase [Chitinophagales bacterium]|nr:isoprenyl transferase [Chitinophagales bacterium]
MDLKQQINLAKLPEHIAIIMDGNGRWARRLGKNRIFGHRNGVTAVRDATEACAELGVKYLTLYAFSTENWNRPKMEVDALMDLLVSTIKNEVKTLMKNNIRLLVIGDMEQLPPKSRKKLSEAMETTQHNTHMSLVLALSYSSKWELTNAIKAIAQEVRDGKLGIDDIDDQLISSRLSTKGMPDPELMIRTSGEHRISNFLLWQLAYAELYFTDILWPEFKKDDLYRAILDYQQRERRFGKISEQLNNE